MRLPNNGFARVLALGLTALVAACGRGPDQGVAIASANATALEAPGTGPEADYPIVLGDPYTVDGKLYTPVDTLNHDEVGYATSDVEGGASVTASHKTLPLPSYVEVTALDTGKTALVRVERRGPMTSSRVIALSQGARAQLGLGADGAGVRVRRVNPPESDRAKLRMGAPAVARMDTPTSLLAILKRSLPAQGSVSLAQGRPAMPVAAAAASVRPVPPSSSSELPAVAKSTVTPVPVAKATSAPASKNKAFDNAFGAARKANRSYPLPPLDGATLTPMHVAKTTAGKVKPETAYAQPVNTVTPVPEALRPKGSKPAAGKGNFVIQAGAYSVKANAERAASAIGGFIEKSGRLYRVRKGPFANRGQANAALAKVRSEGYRDARVYPIG